jgi:hypothetical protein
MITGVPADTAFTRDPVILVKWKLNLLNLTVKSHS